MTDQQLLERITLDPKVMVGKPVVKGTRLTVRIHSQPAGARRERRRRLSKSTTGWPRKIFEPVCCSPKIL